MSAKSVRGFRATCILFGLAAAGMLSLPVHAVMPVVKTVPWVASNPTIPHTTFPGKAVTLKGTADRQGSNFTYTWDFGDGTPPANGTVTNQRVIEASHTYAGAVGTIYTATLTVRDTSTAESASKAYFVEMKAKGQPTEVNVAIDEGLWYLHKTMVPYLTDQGYWAYNYNTETPANLNAFFVNGHLETGASSNPYTDTVQRGMRYMFAYLLRTTAIPSTKTYPAPIGTVNPDYNNNGIAVYGYDSYVYSSGIYMTAIVASGTPDAITSTGPASVIGRKYKDIVQDMVDGYAYGQTQSGTWMGGWGYDWLNGNSDNSVNQWAVIGMMAADGWGGTVVVPAFVKTANKNSLNSTQATTANCGAGYDGAFAYTNNYCYFPWGPYGTTPAGMVQMVFDGIGRGDAQWNKTENFIRNNFCATGNSNEALREYYYGLFSFTKSMLLTPASKGGPIQFLANQPGNSNPIDWYSAEASAGAACDGVARKLVNDQLPSGNWGLHNVNGYHTYFSTAWAIMMLNKTVFESGVPVAVAKATPNPAVAGQTVTLDGSASFHQDSSKSIVSWQWDFDNNGTWDATGPVVTTSYPSLGNYPVTLRVTDNNSPVKTATTTLIVQVSFPPLAPTAKAGGPYNFCPATKPWFLDGTGSVNPDDGQHQPGSYPGDYITNYAWDLTGTDGFTGASGAQPNVTSFFTGKGTGSYLVQLKVTDNTALSFPASGKGNLTSDPSSATVYVRASTDPACGCISNLAARPKSGKIQLTWAKQVAATSYNVYRGTVNGGPYAKIGSTASTYATFLDSTAVNGTTYYYVVRSVAANTNELCQSNQASATATTR